MNTRFIGTIAVISVAYVAGSAAADEGAKAEKKTFKAADGTTIVGEVSGKGEVAVIFLHGWCGDREFWKHQVKPFAADYKIVAIDQAGHGESGKDRKDWTIDSLAGDVAAIVKELGLKKVVLVGHSMGGPVSLLAAKKLPGTCIGVVGVDTLQNVEMKMPEEMQKGFIEQFDNDFKGMVGRFLPAMIADSGDPELKKWLGDKATAQDKKMAVGLMADSFKLDQVKAMKEAKVPIRCINSGGGFQFHRPTETEANKKLADFAVVEIQDVGHFPMFEKPKEFNEALKRVLAELAKKGS